MLPLEGIRIADLSRALAGPYCTMMLADLGADVIKVERPRRGDDTRGWGPPFVGEPYGPYPGESAYFLALNRNKQSVTVNFKSPEGREIVRDLARKSDVLVENFRAGTLDGLGLGYEDLEMVNPRLIQCSITGFGRGGPDADRPGYDFIVQAEGGLMSITGPREGPPCRVGVPIVDITAGMFAATAILGALHARDRTGKGQRVDVSLLDSELALLTNVASNYLVGGVEPARFGNAHPNIAPYEPVQARDRPFALAVTHARQWSAFCEAVGRPELEKDPRFATNGERVANREALMNVLNGILAHKDADHWIGELREAGVPCGPINTVPEAFEHPQVAERGSLLETQHPSVGSVTFPGFPYQFSEMPAEVRQPPPRLGEHTREVLGGLLGYEATDIDRLEERQVI